VGVFCFFFCGGGGVALPRWLIGYPDFVAMYYHRKVSKCPKRNPRGFDR